MLPANGQAPISLGLLPQNQERILQVPAAAKDLMIAALAVSIEPKGGSPTGAPTGDVLFTAEIITL
jgi:anti-sigma-K factor RskA